MFTTITTNKTKKTTLYIILYCVSRIYGWVRESLLINYQSRNNTRGAWSQGFWEEKTPNKIIHMYGTERVTLWLCSKWKAIFVRADIPGILVLFICTWRQKAAAVRKMWIWNWTKPFGQSVFVTSVNNLVGCRLASKCELWAKRWRSQERTKYAERIQNKNKNKKIKII